ncbi:MAG: leucine-rich repeat domain-containing protein [Salinivirgaceae bacterium]|jgi:hypothetical protein
MNESNLSLTLINAYSVENLNHVTAKIIHLHKKKNLPALQKIVRIVNDYCPMEEEKSSRLFSRLIMLFHPDKVTEYHRLIHACQHPEALNNFAYILPVLSTIDAIGDYQNNELLAPDEFEAEYGWNYHPVSDDYFMVQEEDGNVNRWYDEENPDENPYFDSEESAYDGSFLSALKRKIYGPTYIDFPVHLLEDLEEIEMAEYEIEDLDGIEFCSYVKVLDLPYNSIFDITRLEPCIHIQELYLGSNQIHYIDSIYHLNNLRVLDLSNNKVQDITPLFRLKALEFVNLIGNPVLPKDIGKLKELGVVVVY